jgi:hypothetical protein
LIVEYRLLTVLITIDRSHSIPINILLGYELGKLKNVEHRYLDISGVVVTILIPDKNHTSFGKPDVNWSVLLYVHLLENLNEKYISKNSYDLLIRSIISLNTEVSNNM